MGVRMVNLSMLKSLMWRCGLIIVLLGNVQVSAHGAPPAVDYLTQIKPILATKCYACHGALKQSAGLRLETKQLMLLGGDSKEPVLIPGDSRLSRILQRVTADGEQRMPPREAGVGLSAAEKTLIRSWIDQGAVAPGETIPATAEMHWAFQPVVRPKVPPLEGQTAGENAIDAFLSRQRREIGLTAQPPTKRLTLLRRLHLDLIGIPPSLAAIASCENDPSRRWYEKTVDRLLNDPRHGERWARHWLDVWRYSDWWGLGDQLRNSQQHIWHWRDWVIESLNSDTPYDVMVRLMLASDELYPNDFAKVRATGFLARNFYLFNRAKWMEETVEHISKGFLGLTMNCAKCHDHKYDPISQHDYYRFRAFFEPYCVRVDMVPGEADLTRDGVPRVFDGLPEEPTYVYLRGDARNPDTSKRIQPGVPKWLDNGGLTIDSVSLPIDAWKPEERPWVVDTHRSAAKKMIENAKLEWSLLLREREHAESAGPQLLAEEKVAESKLAWRRSALVSIDSKVAAMRSGDELQPEKNMLAIRDERRMKWAKAQFDVATAEFAYLCAENDEEKEDAKAMVEESNSALANAKEAVETAVQPGDQYMPLVAAKWSSTRFNKSSEDDPPIKFIPHSTGRRAALARWITDRHNPLTARVAVNHIWMRHMGQPLVPTVFDFGRNGDAPTHPELLDWLASEFLDHGCSMKHLHRVIVTSAAYRMSSSLLDGERAQAQDPDNRHWWRWVPMRLESQAVRDSLLALSETLDSRLGGPPVPAEQQGGSKRRSLYFFHSRNQRNRFLMTFDEARVTDCYRRDQSIVPQQALALTNSGLVLEAAESIAENLGNDVKDDSIFIRNAFRVVLGIEATLAEREACTVALRSWRRLTDSSPERARSYMVWTLINHNDFVTIR